MTTVVVFCDNPVKHFTHVYCIQDDFDIDMAYGRLTVSYAEEPDKGWLVVVVDVAPNDKEHRILWPIMPISCVSFVKRLLGIKRPFILTSKQLYDYLRREQP